MKYVKIHKSDLGSVKFNTITTSDTLFGYHLKGNDYMIFTFPDSETFMPNKIQLTEEEFNQEIDGAESNFIYPN